MRSSGKLVSHARRYDDGSLVEIYNRFAPGLYRYAVRMLGDQYSAEDCVGETFSRFIESLNNGRGPYEYLQAYLYSIARNWITDQIRKKALRITELSPKMGSSGNDPAWIVDKKIELDQVRSAMTLLKPDQHQVILLRYLECCSDQEIASRLGKSIGAIRVLHHRGLVCLKSILLKPGNVA